MPPCHGNPSPGDGIIPGFPDLGLTPYWSFQTVHSPVFPERGGVMRNITLAVGSFALGVLSMFFLGHHTSIFWESSAFAQDLKPAFAERDAAYPVVPRIALWTLDGVAVDASMVFKLDGMDCVNCVIRKDGTVEYAGGPFKIERLAIEGPVQIKLSGAALNTAILSILRSIGLSSTKTQRTDHPQQPYSSERRSKGWRKANFRQPGRYRYTMNCPSTGEGRFGFAQGRSAPHS